MKGTAILAAHNCRKPPAGFPLVGVHCQLKASNRTSTTACSTHIDDKTWIANSACSQKCLLNRAGAVESHT
ncbi:hypothetical protein ACKKBF_B41115 [Auxenochlorella protothecoides x Auxenochlorella symbiontica]